MSNAVSNAIAKKDEPHLVERYRADFATVLPTHINADQWVRLARGSFRTNPQLEQILNKNPGSVLRALMDCARLGLVVGDTYHLLPFGMEVTGTPDYTGLIELMYRAGEVTAVKVEIVYEGDHFVYYPGTMDVPDHRPDWFADKRSERPMIGVYAYAKLANGSYSQVVIMDRAAVEKVRNVSKMWQRKDSMWQQWPDRAWRKTAIRQLAKLVPTDTEYRKSKVVDLRDQGRPTPSPAVLEALGGAIPDVLHDDEIQDAEIVHDAEIAPDPVSPPPAGPDLPKGAAIPVEPPAESIPAPTGQAAPTPISVEQKKRLKNLFDENGFPPNDKTAWLKFAWLALEDDSLKSIEKLTSEQAEVVAKALVDLPAPEAEPTSEPAAEPAG